MGGRVVGFLIRGDQLHALTLQERLVAAGATGVLSPSPSTVILDLRREPEPGAKGYGYARDQNGTDVQIDLGEENSLKVDQHILFLDRKRPVRTPGWYGVIAVGVVRDVNPRTAHVEVGQNEAVEPGSFAQVTTLPRSLSVLSPPRTPSPFSMSLFTRPYVALNRHGGGALFEANAALHPRPQLRLELAFSPFGFAETAAQHDIFTFTGFLAISYDSRYWQAGAGIGAQTINSVMIQKPGTGTLFPLLLRFGALDGLNLRLRTDVTLIYQTFRFGALRVEGRVPLQSDLWLEVAGGGGPAGYVLGEFGLRKQFSGNGGSGTNFFTITLGGTQLSRAACQPEPPEFSFFSQPAICTTGTKPAGMHLGLGLEHRF